MISKMPKHMFKMVVVVVESETRYLRFISIQFQIGLFGKK